MVMLIVGGSEEGFESKVSIFLLDEILDAQFVVALAFLQCLPLPPTLSLKDFFLNLASSCRIVSSKHYKPDIISHF